MLPRRRLGRTELRVTGLGFGGLGILDRYMRRWKAGRGFEAARGVIDAALSCGINFLDTGRWYGNSEERIGRVIAQQRANCILASKTHKRDQEGVRRDIEKSLYALQTDHIEIYKIHHVQWGDELTTALGPGGALEGLRLAQNEGLVSFIGISAHRVDFLRQAIETREFDVVEVPYNVLDHTTYQPVIDLAHELDVGILSMKALAAGKLSGKAEEALHFALAAPKVDCVVVGMSTVSQVRSNCSVAKETGALSLEAQRNVFQELSEHPIDHWGLTCEHYDQAACPFGVPIDRVLWLARYAEIYKSSHHAKWLYSKLATNASHCESCVAYCQTRCPYGLSIRTYLIEAHNRLIQPVTAYEVLQHGGTPG